MKQRVSILKVAFTPHRDKTYGRKHNNHKQYTAIYYNKRSHFLHPLLFPTVSQPLDMAPFKELVLLCELRASVRNFASNAHASVRCSSFLPPVSSVKIDNINRAY